MRFIPRKEKKPEPLLTDISSLPTAHPLCRAIPERTMRQAGPFLVGVRAIRRR